MTLLARTVFAVLVFAAAPVAAQTALHANADRTGNPDTMTCKGMIDFAAMRPAGARQKAAARSQIVLARTDLKGGRETSCKTHMKLALQALD